MAPTVHLLSEHAANLEVALQFAEDAGTPWERDPAATEAEALLEFCGRVCYMSFGPRQSPRTNREYIANLIRSGHESVLEHVSWTMLITGISRAFTHQLVRHRVGFAYSQLSQQYYDQREQRVVMPSVLDQYPDLAAAWRKAVDGAIDSYADFIEDLDEAIESTNMPVKERRRLIRSTARSVLPEGTETTISVTANARAIRHFLSIRGAIEGDEEMRRVSAAILQKLEPTAPAIFQDFFVENMDDGSPIVRRRELADTLSV